MDFPSVRRISWKVLRVLCALKRISVPIPVCRHAGVLVPAKGIVDIAITVVDSTPATGGSRYDCALIATVSHTRLDGVPFETPETAFVPFRAGQSIVQHTQLERPVRLVLGTQLAPRQDHTVLH